MPFTMYYGGAEEPGWRRLLIEQGVAGIALSYRHLHKRLPKTKPWLVADRCPGVEVVVESPHAVRPAQDEEEHLAVLHDSYIDFLAYNEGDIARAMEFDAATMGLDFVLAQRRDYWDQHPDMHMAVWIEGQEQLEALCEQYRHIGIPDLKPNAPALRTLPRLGQKYGTQFHAVGASDPDVLKVFDSASTHSWLSATKYGETIVWNGTALKRYPAKMKGLARKRHRTLFTKAGFDAERIERDDGDELARFTVWSFRQLESYLDQHRQGAGSVTGQGHDLTPAITENGMVAVAEPPPRMRNERSVLPVVLQTPVKGSESQFPEVPATTVRRCSTCHVQANCPAYNPGAECAFDIPVEVRTKEQLLGLLQGTIAMQAQRVAFGRYAEELEGGYPDPNVSNEMDRLMRVIFQAKQIQDDRDFLTLTVHAQGQAGVLSRIFGSREAQPVHNLQRQLGPSETDHVIATVLDVEDADVVEAQSSNTNGHAPGGNGT